MAPPISTYQMENFDPPPDEELICSICRCVFYDPVECPCRHVYCQACISNWLNRHKTCPVCRKRASVTTLQTVVPLIKNMIMKLTINCPNVERGCTQKMPLEAKASHLMNCEYEMVQCRNANCKEKFVRKDIAKHEQKECKCRKVRCRRKCMLMIPFNVIKTHSCVEELKKELKEKKSLIEDLKKEVEQYKAELKKAKNELQQAVSNNRSLDFSDDLGSLHSDNSFSLLSTANFTDSDTNLSDFSNTNSFNSDENDFDSDFEEPELRSFIDLVLMTLFPPSNETTESEHTEHVNISSSSQNLTDNDATREVSLLTASQQETRSQASINDSEQLNLPNDVEVTRNSTDRATSRSVTLPGALLEQECRNSDISSGEIIPTTRNGNLGDGSVDENTLSLRSRMLKRKSPIPVLSDSGETEPQRIRRRWDDKHLHKSNSTSQTNTKDPEMSLSLIKNGVDRASTSANCEQTSENCSSLEIPNVCPSTSSAYKAPGTHFARGKFTKNKIPVSRVPVVISCIGEGEALNSNQNNCDPQQTDILQPLHYDLSNEMQPRTTTDGNNHETGRCRRTLHPVFGLSGSIAQRALQRLKNYAQHSRVETGTNSSEHEKMSTLELLNRLAEESDPDWEPPDDDVDDGTDETISDAVESDSSYEVKIPERTWDMLERYSQEPSDDDDDWLPPCSL